MAQEFDPRHALESGELAKVLGSTQITPLPPDEWLGTGYSMRVADPPVRLEVHPECADVRVQSVSGLMSLRIGPVSNILRRGHRLRIEGTVEGERAVVEVSPSGFFTGGWVSETAARSERRYREGQDGMQLGELGERPRLTLRGRLVREVKMGETASRKIPVARLRLAVHHGEGDSDYTSYHSIVAFGKRAQQVAEKQLKKGQEVDVVGYVHARESKTRAGTSKHVEDVYLTALRTTFAPPPGMARR
jgi:hypothetical protein